ncbi:hypothetical protein DCC81_24685 [Chitinophaga parva]|uniref:Uncharacterized protein n=1 Tax=Chitinophaga parva TaxID=2169414 RepID=A0A2T7BBT4_9BACT|nr:hypothetical protein [Chitinophaga parva]PUZ21788.1 hypothetical protein DCC81_24685 [Chitinophaga parva]
MIEAKFQGTPGSWTAEELSTASGSYRPYVILSPEARSVCKTSYLSGDPKQEKENAYLIAAAPDLLEALMSCMSEIEAGVITSPALKKADAAVRKALHIK